MWKTLLAYGLALAAGSLALQWLEYGIWARFHPLEVYLTLLALAFLALGVWVGAKLFRGPAANGSFEPNKRARASLGITDREYDVLRQLAAGRSNKEIARQLEVSPIPSRRTSPGCSRSSGPAAVPRPSARRASSG
jgi:regulatory LuxR family protein